MLKRVSKCFLACVLVAGLCPAAALADGAPEAPSDESSLSSVSSWAPDAPVYVIANNSEEAPFAIDVEWGIDASAGTGYGVIDHFNIYRDGELVAQTHQSIVTEVDGAYAWHCVLPVEHAWQFYTVEVTAVGVNGVESEKSVSDGYFAMSGTNEINSWFVEAYPDSVLISAMTEADGAIQVYRDGTYVGTTEYGTMWDLFTLEDTDVEPGTVCNYRLVCVDDRGKPGNADIAFTVAIPEDDEDVVMFETPLVEATQYEGTVSLAFDLLDTETAIVYRNGARVAAYQGSELATPSEHIVFEDTPEAYGSYAYSVYVTDGVHAASAPTYYYEKVENRAIVGDLSTYLPGAPALRWQLTDDGCVVLEWQTPETGDAPEAYYLFCEREDGVAVEPFVELLNGAYDSVDAATHRYVFMPEWGLNDNGEPITYNFSVRAHCDKHGTGAPSEIVTLSSAEDGSAPAFECDEAPGAPVLDVQLKPAANGYNFDTAVLTWGLPETGGAVASYHIEVLYPSYMRDDYGDYFMSEDATAEIYLNQGYGTYVIAVTAENDFGSTPATYIFEYMAVPDLLFAADTSSVTLLWDDLQDGTAVNNFVVYRKSPYTLAEPIAVLDASTHEFVDNSPIIGGESSYWVVAVTNDGERSSAKKTISFSSSMTPCSAPRLQAQVISEGILLSWKAPSRGVADDYFLYCRDVTEGQTWDVCDWFPVEGGANVLSYVYNNTEKLGHEMEFRVVARNIVGFGANSRAVSATMPTELSAPAALPAPVTASIIEGEHNLTLTWSAPSADTTQPVFYHIMKWVGDSAENEDIIIAAPATQWVDTNVSPFVEYGYLVLACNAAGEHEGYSFADMVSGTITGEAEVNDEAVMAVEEIIMDNVPVASEVTLDDADVIDQVLQIYNMLDAAQKRAMSSEATERLTAAVIALQVLAPSDADLQAAARVEGMIGQIPDVEDIAVGDSDTITFASRAYASLTDVQRALVSEESVSTLSAAGERLAVVQAEAFGNPLNPSISDDPESPGTDPDEPGTDPVDPDNPGTDPVDPVDPDQPGTDPENPGTDPDNPGTDPDNPGKDPDNPGTDPDNPENPGTDPVDPDQPGTDPVDPDNPGTDPDGPDNPGTDPEDPEDPVDPVDPEDPTEEWPTEGTEGFAARLYFAILGRAPDAEGFAVQVSALNRGSQPAEIAYNYFNSYEYFSKHLSNEQIVEDIYHVMFGRDSDAAGAALWVGYLDSGMSIRSVVQGFSQAQEYRNYFGSLGLDSHSITLFNSYADKEWDDEGNLIYAGGNYRDLNSGATAFAARMYTVVLGRSAEVGGLNVQSRALSSGTSCATVAKSFFTSSEFAGRGLSPEEIVRIAYQAILGRSAEETENDVEGRAYWAGRLKNEPGFTTASLVNGFCQSGEFADLCREYGLRSGM